MSTTQARWRRVVPYLGVLTASLILGLGSAVLALRLSRGQLQNGPWVTSLLTGSREAGLYLRAQIAVKALFALSREETIYFIATEDGAGEPLRASCRYRLDGGELPARWWSVTAYGSDHYLIENPLGRYSFNRENLERQPDRTWTIHVGPEEQRPNWIPSGAGSGRIELTLRLYNPAPAILPQLATVSLPTIVREGCR